jgi:hypothetical protein
MQWVLLIYKLLSYRIIIYKIGILSDLSDEPTKYTIITSLISLSYGVIVVEYRNRCASLSFI